ncbi:hypothetical protein [Flavobacterium oreochromis]|uniref:hypothetical protein n=1 Tax=Flavobacterium oreochromis TaxID=2906078 RepID=UPI00385B8828
MKKILFLFFCFSIKTFSQTITPQNTLTKKLEFISNGEWNTTVTTPSNVNDFTNGYTFAYPSSGAPWSGAFLSFGGLNNAYDCQISTNYSEGNAISFRTRNGDNMTWNSWKQFYHTGNINNSEVNFIAKDLYAINNSPTLFLKRKNNNGNYTQGIQTQLEDGKNNWFFGNVDSNSWVVSKGDYRDQKLVVKDNGNVGLGTINPREKLEVDGGNIGISYSTSEGPALSFHNPSKTEPGAIWRIYNMTGSYGNSLQFWNYPSNWATANQRMILHDNGNMNLNGSLTVSGNALMNDVISNGSNSWIFHSPDDGRTSLYIAPSINNDWKWEKAFILNNGNAALNGKLEVKEIKVTTTPTADFVFDEAYKLPNLEDVEKHIKEKKHLPEIASAKQMKQEGVNVGKFQIQLLQKIEELTLYSIEQNKKINEQYKDLLLQKEQIKQLKEEINLFKKQVKNK